MTKDELYMKLSQNQEQNMHSAQTHNANKLEFGVFALNSGGNVGLKEERRNGQTIHL